MPKNLFLLGFILLFSGCDPEPPPQTVPDDFPPMIKRSQWLPAREAPRPDSLLENRYAEPLNHILTRIVVHHTGMESDSPLSYYRFHTRTRHYADIAYHYLIASDGKLYEGRPIEYMGAHLRSRNFGSIGIVLFGNLDLHPPTDSARLMLGELIRNLKHRYPIREIGGHRDFSLTPTSCPGKKFCWPEGIFDTPMLKKNDSML